MKLGEIAQKFNLDLVGDPKLEVSGVAAEPQSAVEGEIALAFDFARAKKYLAASKASVFVLPSEIKDRYQDIESTVKSFLFHPRPRYFLVELLPLFAKARYYPPEGIHASAVIDPSAEVDPSASLGANVVIGPNSKIGARTKLLANVVLGADVSIGEDSLIYPGVSIEDYSELGNRVIIHANAVIGSDGYSYCTQEPSNLEKIRTGSFELNFGRQENEKIVSAGNVVIHDDVEIGSNTSVDRGTIGSTIIGEGTKIDNQCQIAHNVQIGKDCLIIAKTGIAGSVKVQDRVTMAGGSGCRDGITIGNDVVVGAYSAVNHDLDPLLPVLGIPAIPYGEFMKRQKALGRLVESQKELKALQEKVEEIENKN